MCRRYSALEEFSIGERESRCLWPAVRSVAKVCFVVAAVSVVESWWVVLPCRYSRWALYHRTPSSGCVHSGDEVALLLPDRCNARAVARPGPGDMRGLPPKPPHFDSSYFGPGETSQASPHVSGQASACLSTWECCTEEKQKRGEKGTGTVQAPTGMACLAWKKGAKN